MRYRIFIICVLISSYGLIVFHNNLDGVSNKTVELAIYHIVLPSAAMMILAILIPEFMFKTLQDQKINQGDRQKAETAVIHVPTSGVGEQKGKDRDSNSNDTNKVASDSYSEDYSGFEKYDLTHRNMDNEHGGSVFDLHHIDVPSESEEFAPQKEQDRKSIIMKLINEAIDQKTSQITNDVAIVKSEMKNMKDSIQQTTSLFESALTDIKAFQAEMVNPLNFMRKYFETLDIKNLSDPTQPLSHPEFAYDYNNDNDRGSNSSTALVVRNGQESERPLAGSSDTHPDGKTTTTAAATVNATENREVSATDNNGSDVGESNKVDAETSLHQMFGTKLTLCKMMSMVSIIEEILKRADHSGIKILIEQYKMLGLKPEDERVIYNIVSMLTESDMPANEIISMLYKFGQSLGLNDKDADLYYTKLLTNNVAGNMNLENRKKITKRMAKNRRGR